MRAQVPLLKLNISHPGSHHRTPGGFEDTLFLDAKHSGLTIMGHPGEKAEMSGGKKLQVTWKPYNVTPAPAPGAPAGGPAMASCSPAAPAGGGMDVWGAAAMLGDSNSTALNHLTDQRRDLRKRRGDLNRQIRNEERKRARLLERARVARRAVQQEEALGHLRAQLVARVLDPDADPPLEVRPQVLQTKKYRQPAHPQLGPTPMRMAPR